jgi:hypothetical protein
MFFSVLDGAEAAGVVMDESLLNLMDSTPDSDCDGIS